MDDVKPVFIGYCLQQSLSRFCYTCSFGTSQNRKWSSAVTRRHLILYAFRVILRILNKTHFSAEMTTVQYCIISLFIEISTETGNAVLWIEMRHLDLVKWNLTQRIRQHIMIRQRGSLLFWFNYLGCVAGESMECPLYWNVRENQVQRG